MDFMLNFAILLGCRLFWHPKCCQLPQLWRQKGLRPQVSGRHDGVMPGIFIKAPLMPHQKRPKPQLGNWKKRLVRHSPTGVCSEWLWVANWMGAPHESHVFWYFRKDLKESTVGLFCSAEQATKNYKKIQVPESGASETQRGGPVLVKVTGFQPWICMAINGPKLRGISWNAMVKGNGILGAWIPDVARRCLANSYGYMISLALSSSWRLVTL